MDLKLFKGRRKNKKTSAFSWGSLLKLDDPNPRALFHRDNIKVPKISEIDEEPRPERPMVQRQADAPAGQRESSRMAIGIGYQLSTTGYNKLHPQV